MKVIGVIPARYASTRFPGKPLAKILGREMISWVLEGAQKSPQLQEVWLATDDERIAEVGRKQGVNVALTDSQLQSGSDRIWAAIKNVSCDVVVNIQGDEPLVSIDWIEKLTAPFRDSGVIEMSTLSTRLRSDEIQNPNIVKVISDQKGQAIYFSRFPIPFSRQESQSTSSFIDSKIVQKHVGMYAYRKNFLQKFCSAPPSPLELAESLEQLRALDLGAKIAVREIETLSLGVDTPEDLIKAEQILKESHGLKK